jgi:hypothetical protein
MTSAVPPCLNLWKTLYRAAILETNKWVIARRREIFYSSGSPEEKEALEDALYALRAYRTAWQHTEAA